MKVFLILTFLFFTFACSSIHYLSEPVKETPSLWKNSSNYANGILLACNKHLKADSCDIVDCLQGFRLNFKTKPGIKILDEIDFIKNPNTAILTELKDNYHADGILLLTKLKIEKSCIYIPGPIVRAGDNRVAGPNFRVYYRQTYFTDLLVTIISRWEFHDFTTGWSYAFDVKNEKIHKSSIQILDVNQYLEENYRILNALLYQNGKMTANRLCRPPEE